MLSNAVGAVSSHYTKRLTSLAPTKPTALTIMASFELNFTLIKLLSPLKLDPIQLQVGCGG